MVPFVTCPLKWFCSLLNPSSNSWFYFFLSSGLNILYPGEAEINNLLKLVLTEGENVLLPGESGVFLTENKKIKYISSLEGEQFGILGTSLL